MNKQKEIFFNKYQWFIIAGGFIFIIVTLLREIYFSFDPLFATEKEWARDWLLQFIRKMSLSISLGSMVVFGIRLLRIKGFSLKRIIIPLIGISLFVYLICTSFGYYTFFTYFDEMLHIDTAIKKIEISLQNEQLSDDNRATISKVYASLRYRQGGEIVEYYVSKGITKLYKPTDEDEKIRKELILIEWIENKMKVAGIIWSSLGVLSIFLGLFTPLCRKDNVERINESMRKIKEE